MKNRKNSYSIRKLSIGASSIIVASMLLLGPNCMPQNKTLKGNSENHIAQSIGAENDKNSEKQSNVENDNKSSLETKIMRHHLYIMKMLNNKRKQTRKIMTK